MYTSHNVYLLSAIALRKSDKMVESDIDVS